MKRVDVIIIGTGPAGLTAGIYASRYKLKTLIIGKLRGGTAGKAYEIYNFPTYEKILGFEFVEKMVSQVKKLGVEIAEEEVLDIKKSLNASEGFLDDPKFKTETKKFMDIKKKENSGFEVTTNKNKYYSKKIIIATGTEKKKLMENEKLHLPKEKELTGKGISYCATCDAGLYKNKIVAVVGGSNSALSSALLLAKYAKKVYIIYRGGKFYKADPAWIGEIKKNKKITVLLNSEITKLVGKEFLKEIEILEEEKKRGLNIDGLFIEVGNTPNTELARKLNIKFDGDYIEVNKRQETNVNGVFAAGDITNNPLKQIITACSEGAVAAYSTYKELEAGK
ncbi:MAG: FAD-dependent oxidoreductase [archaeon]|nr:FAD-dependent oxidoreductase [archaeon]